MGKSGADQQREPINRSRQPAGWYGRLAALQEAVEEARRQRENMPPGTAASEYALELAAFADAAEVWLEAAPDYPAR